MSDEIEIKPKEAISNYNNWVKKNLFTVIGIIIILSLVLYDVATVQKDKKDIVKDCNEYWRSELEYRCPNALNSTYSAPNLKLPGQLEP